MSKMDSKVSEPIQQASAIPYRWNGERLEFCLITSMRSKRWIFPKGVIDPGETFAETALKESYEEAGLSGRIVGDPIGDYHYEKWNSTLHVTVVVMEVTRCDEKWQEADARSRRWVKHRKARALVSEETLKDLLDLAVERIQHPQ